VIILAYFWSSHKTRPFLSRSDVAGTWRKDAAFVTLAAQDTIDKEMWR
jgi:hypothetical protein